MPSVKPIFVFKSDDLGATRRFYEALGLTLVEETHEGCPPHLSCDLGLGLLEFYPTGPKAGPIKPGNDLLLVFEIDDLDPVMRMVRDLDLKHGAVDVYDPDRRLRAVTVHDPDDRRVRVREVAPPPLH